MRGRGTAWHSGQGSGSQGWRQHGGGGGGGGLQHDTQGLGGQRGGGAGHCRGLRFLLPNIDVSDGMVVKHERHTSDVDITKNLMSSVD